MLFWQHFSSYISYIKKIVRLTLMKLTPGEIDFLGFFSGVSDQKIVLQK